MAASPDQELNKAANPRSRWVRAIQDTSRDDARAAFRELVETYWYCVYAWWRRTGLDAAQAAAATLASFTRWLGDAPPRASDASATRMREWMPARLAELATAGVTLDAPVAIEIDPAFAEHRYADEPPGEPDAVFHRRWALTVLEFAVTSLRAEYAARGEETLFAELLSFAGFASDDHERYAETAARMGLSTGAMHKAVFDFRTRQRELLCATVADTLRDPSDTGSEITALLCACDVPGADAVPAPLPTAIRAVRPDEMFARAMQTVRMTQSSAHGWQPPEIAEIARLFPGYEVLSLLGRGGMGAVYRARQTALDRLVAIKLLPLEISVDQAFADRFRREARAMAKLNHPHIIAVHDFGTTSEGHLFFVMEYVEGANLHDIIHQAGLDPDQTLSIAEQVCAALGYAHGKGIVHRDIKPANVMIDTESHVKVADFGLARLIDKGTADLGHTVTGTVMGTPDYMAPEQMKGMNVDHRADIYSLGVMIYEMLCREVPKGIFQTPSVRTGCDTRIDAIVIKAMQQAPEHRYQSTQEMKADVTAARTPVVLPQVAAAPLPKPPRVIARPRVSVPVTTAKSRTLLYAGIAVVVLALAGAFIHFVSSKPNRTGKETDSSGLLGQIENTLAAASKEQPFVNTLGMKFVPVPGTSVLFSVWDTRVRDYAVYARVDKSDDSWTKQQKDGVPISRDPEDPVVGVNWEDARVFCQWLTQKETAEGRLPKGAKYRLPTDEEWSQAVGLPAEQGATPAEKSQKNSTDFPWGVGYPPPKAKVGNYMDTAFHEKFPKEQWIEGYTDGYATTSPVGSFPANAYGLYDMGGNVWQWCEERGLRGASWLSWEKAELLSSVRVKYSPEVRWKQFGFRCVLVPAPVVPSAQSATAFAAATKEQPFVNTLGMKFVPVPILGGPTGGQRVLFCIWETRVKDYRAFAETTKNKVPEPGFAQTDDHPVVKVSWNEAEAFCEWLSRKEGLEYRLPTDHEWSCAVGIGDREDPSVSPGDKDQKIPGVFPWGTEWPPPRGSGNLADATAKRKTPDWKVIDNYDDGFAHTSPVGAFAANQFGIYDLSGNVWEWCKDVVKLGDPYRYQRGACFFDAFPGESLSSRRTGSPGGNWVSGFRCVVVGSSSAR